MARNDEHFFMCFFAISISSFDKDHLETQETMNSQDNTQQKVQ
jgi:hypothetical protein